MLYDSLPHILNQFYDHFLYVFISQLSYSISTKKTVSFETVLIIIDMNAIDSSLQ